MSVLLEKITKIDEPAAKKIEEAGFRSDSEIRDLTREDLRELLPGPKNMKIRINIFKTISKTDSLSELLKKLQGFIPHDLKATLSKTGLLADYLHILKDMKTKQNNVQMFLEAFIKHLESRCGAPSGQEPASASTSKAVVNQSGKSTKVLSKQTSQDLTNGWVYEMLPAIYVTESHRITGFHGNSSHDSCGKPCSRSQKRGESTGSSYRYITTRKPPVTVKYKMVVSGKTFGADQQILNQIRSSAQELNLVDVEVNGCIEDDSQITLVFCPVVSRMGTDVEAAMKKVPDVKPVILVLMHHSHEVRHVGSMRSWTDKCKIVLHVNVFYHEKVPGLIICQQNDEAITAVKKEILTYGITDGHSGSDGATSTGFNSDGANDSASQKNNQAGLFSQIFSHLRP
uniref:Si:ch211-245h14.1 n=1 Tax=Iconisemion striatum TaxID=60296 RepID=A0A1A7YBU6_9TELE